jgi:hypothetical protein
VGGEKGSGRRGVESLGVWECDGWIRRGYDGGARLMGLMERRWHSDAYGLRQWTARFQRVSVKVRYMMIYLWKLSFE